MSQPAHRSTRLEARIAPDVLDVVKRAAELQGRSVSDFVVSAAREAAHRAIEEAQVIRLSVEDQTAFAAAIIDPPEPSASLRRAGEVYRRQIQRSG